MKVKKRVTIALSVDEASRLLQETLDVKVGSKPVLHELIDRLDEVLAGP